MGPDFRVEPVTCRIPRSKTQLNPMFHNVASVAQTRLTSPMACSSMP